MKQLISNVIKEIKAIFPDQKKLLSFISESNKYNLFYKKTRENTYCVIPLPKVKKDNNTGLELPETYKKEKELEDNLRLDGYNIGLRVSDNTIVLYASYGNLKLSDDCNLVYSDNIYLVLDEEYIKSTYV